MPKTIRRSPLVAGVLVLLVAVGVGVTACGDDDSADLPAGVVARVGDARITDKQLERAVAQTTAEATSQGQTAPEEGTEAYDQLRQQALQGLVQQKIVGFEARDCGKPCAVSAKEVDQELDRIIEANFSGKPKEFQDFLKQRGITQADARDIVTSSLQQQKLFDNVTRGVRFSDADAKKYYEDNAGEFKVAKHILVPTEAKAEQIRAEATTANFGELAQQNSTDEGSAKQGGSLGPIRPGTFVPAFEEAALALDDGEISQPVKTQFGWHIITVGVTPFAEAEQQIVQTQLAQKRQTAFTEWSEKVIGEWRDRTVYADAALEPPATTEAQPPVATTP